jgi:hypothetical protein
MIFAAARYLFLAGSVGLAITAIVFERGSNQLALWLYVFAVPTGMGALIMLIERIRRRRW